MSDATRYEWRYLPSRQPTVKHALSYSAAAGAQCGVTALPASAWMGTGSQREYETAERLRYCRRCLAKVGKP